MKGNYSIITSIVLFFIFSLTQNALGVGGGSKGAIYAIESNGDMLYYKFDGLKDGAKKWSVTGKKIGNGWRFKNVFAGDK